MGTIALRFLERILREAPQTLALLDLGALAELIRNSVGLFRPALKIFKLAYEKSPQYLERILPTLSADERFLRKLRAYLSATVEYSEENIYGI